MELYFVRHGQTGGNVAKRHQAEFTPLTTEGRAQVEATAVLLKDLQPTHLITSTHVRALESASIIAGTTGLFPETERTLIEVHRPEWLYGYHFWSPKSIWFVVRWFFGFIGGATDSEEGESYASLRQRIGEAQLVLQRYPADARVVVVSHSVFINFFLAHMCNRKRMTFVRAVLSWRLIRGMKNASVTKVRYTADATGCKWQRMTEDMVRADA